MSDRPTMPCPKCGVRSLDSFYGGKRGETGPFLRCTELGCDYDEEAEEGARYREAMKSKLAAKRGPGRDLGRGYIDRLARLEDRVVWLNEGRIITRNADGGTTAWDEADAVRLYESLGVILEGLGLRSPLDG